MHTLEYFQNGSWTFIKDDYNLARIYRYLLKDHPEAPSIGRIRYHLRYYSSYRFKWSKDHWQFTVRIDKRKLTESEKTMLA